MCFLILTSGLCFFHYNCVLHRNAGKIDMSKYWFGQGIDIDFERSALETACDIVFH